MTPPPPEEEPGSHDPSFSSLPLTTALRISISGEGMELGPEPLASDPITGKGESGEDGGVVSGEGERLSIAEDMPVDLRAKLAVAMIHLGETVPEVSTIATICHKLAKFL